MKIRNHPSKRPVTASPKIVNAKQTDIISDIEIQKCIQLAYESKRLWGEYFNIYYDLFTEECLAELKAKTYSIKFMCNQLRNIHGCSFQQIYLALLKLVGSANIILAEDQIDLKSKSEFIYSLNH